MNLQHAQLSHLVRMLGPSYLRVGGSEADKIHYLTESVDAQQGLLLSQGMWDDLHTFVREHNLKLAFTFKYGLFKRRQQGEWQGTELQALLQYSVAQGFEIDVCELGNELNAYWAFYGLRSQPVVKDLVSDYQTFAETVRCYYPNIKICGPGSAFWPRLGEAIRPLTNITPKFLSALDMQLDIVDWHYYPFQSERSPVRTRLATMKRTMSARSFNTFSVYGKRLQLLRDRFQPQADIWTGETGSAQCGGQPKLSDRFCSCFWWADQLGQGGLLGQKVMVRQSLVGGDYGLIDRQTLLPRPDFWLSWLWVQLMGERVYKLQCGDRSVRAYCHSDSSGYGHCMLLINTSGRAKKLSLSSLGSPVEAFVLTADSLDASEIHINGVRAQWHYAAKGSSPSLEDYRCAGFIQAGSPLTLLPYSITFCRLSK